MRLQSISDPSYADHFWSRVDKSGGCWPWTGTCLPRGYGSAAIGHHQKGYAHRVAWEMADGSPAGKLWVLHTCDNPPCVRNDEPGVYVVNGIAYPRWGHLWLGDRAANNADMIAKGRHAHGATHGSALHPLYLPTGITHHMAKLNPDAVKDIRESYETGRATQKQLALRYSVSQSQIHKAVHRITWKDV